MTLTHDHHPMNEALYCRATGRRLSPVAGLEPAAGAPIAVAVFDDGESVPLFGDTVLGRSPELDPRVRRGEATPLTLDDPTAEMSRCHALLRVNRWEVEVIDLGSRNGTALQMVGADSAADPTWRRIMPGLAASITDGQPILLASRVISIYHLQL